LLRFLTEPKNALTKQFKKLFHMEGVDLEFRPDAIDEIASQAIIREQGLEGLRSIMEESLKEVMFELPGVRNLKTVVIDRASIKDKTKPYFVYSEEKKSNSAV
jgi:ATP-dependent Clp protease ATP-binding subunit ClpX